MGPCSPDPARRDRAWPRAPRRLAPGACPAA